MKFHLQDEKVCFMCGREYGLERHHIFYGTANRKKSEKYNLCVWLCHAHHNEPPDGVHFNKEKDNELKRYAQKEFELVECRELFVAEFGRSYL